MRTRAGTLLTAHDHALGTSNVTVNADATLELMEGVSITNDVTLAANATLQVDDVLGGATTGAITTPASGKATVKVAGDATGLKKGGDITLGALADGASVATLELDTTGLTLPNRRWRAKLVAKNGSLVLRIKKPSGFTLIVR